MYPDIQNKVYKGEHLGGLPIFFTFTRMNIFGNVYLWVCRKVTFLWNLLEWTGWNKGYEHHYGSYYILLNFLSSSKSLGFLENLSHSQVAAAKLEASSQLLVPPQSLKMAKQTFPHSFRSWMIKTKWKPCAGNWLTASNGWNITLHKWPETSWINKINSELHSFPESESGSLEHGFTILFLAYFLKYQREGPDVTMN